MNDGVWTLKCPCCGADLEIDAESGVLLSHRAPKSSKIPVDLQEAVRELKSREQGRDELFAKQIESERRHEKDLGLRFEGLLKKARTEPPGRPKLRDIDLD